MPWLGLTLDLDPAMAEAFSEALLEAGVLSVSLDNLDAPQPTLHVLLAAGSDPRRVIEQAARASGVAAPRFCVREVADEDWVRTSQAQFAPIEIGARLWVGPSWHQPPTGRAAVRLDPGLAFGTGSHPTTRLVLAFLERCIQGGERVLDYGCGSGILAIAAAKLGAALVDGVDVDPQAVETAAANARVNGVGLRAAPPEALAQTTYDIVVSNILAQPLIVLAPLLAARAAAAGRIALSGILETQAAEVAAAYAPWFDMQASELQEGWALLVGARR
ncbi:MAG TPA: 50S ribosomal protein L11 methyltransferase [Burkholderiales bacterium]|nr:50S ribosomal protein L11 methyltransferase [Burkholderiales bacterium]